MRYNCDECKYESYDFGNYSRHLKSIKHGKNTNNNQKNIEDQNKDHVKDHSGDHSQKNNIECKYCGKMFTVKTHMYRHMKYYCKNKKDTRNIKLQLELERVKSELEMERREKQIRNEMEQKMNEELAKKDREAIELKKINEKLTDANLTNTKVAERHASTMSYVLENYKNAPPVALLKGDQLNNLIVYGPDDSLPIGEVLISYHKKGKLHMFLGDLIINRYVKDDPREQSIWSSDISRLNFLLRMSMDDIDSDQWITDKSGINLKKIIIIPIVKKVVKIMNNYLNNHYQYSEKYNNKTKIDSIIEKQIHENIKSDIKALEIKNNAKFKNLENAILRHISPHFGIRTNNVDSNDTDSTNGTDFDNSDSDDN